MRIKESRLLPHDLPAIGAVLSRPDEWVPDVDAIQGEDLLAKVGTHLGVIPIYKELRFRVDERPRWVSDSKVVVKIRWTVVGDRALFPHGDGELEAESQVGSNVTEISLTIDYEPPLGELGELIDRRLMHRVATATVDDFVERIVKQIDYLLDHRIDVADAFTPEY